MYYKYKVENTMNNNLFLEPKVECIRIVEICFFHPSGICSTRVLSGGMESLVRGQPIGPLRVEG